MRILNNQEQAREKYNTKKRRRVKRRTRHEQTVTQNTAAATQPGMVTHLRKVVGEISNVTLAQAQAQVQVVARQPEPARHGKQTCAMVVVVVVVDAHLTPTSTALYHAPASPRSAAD